MKVQLFSLNPELSVKGLTIANPEWAVSSAAPASVGQKILRPRRCTYPSFSS